MESYMEFAGKVICDWIVTENRMRQLERKIRVLQGRNEELEQLVGYLKDRIVEYDPGMKEKFEALRI